MAVKKMLILSLTFALYSTMMTATPGYAGSYTMTDLGPGSAWAINNSGQVVGTSGNRAFLYSNGTMTDLGTFPGGTYSNAQGINNSGQVIGFSNIAGGMVRAWLYSSGTMTDLGSLGGATRCYPRGINDTGQVVGYCGTNAFPTDMHAFLYSDGTMTDLGTLGSATYSYAYGINNSGQVTGYSGGTSFIYSNGTMTNTWGGRAYAINNNGQVTGYSFIYSNGTSTQLGDLVRLGIGSQGVSINISGDVVGNYATTSWGGVQYTNGFIRYSDGSVIDLSDMYGIHATGINDSGQIVGYGSISGVSHAFLLTPTPADTTPDPFSFEPATGVTLSTTVTSNPITVQGINAPVTISVTGGSYSINNGSFKTAAGYVTNGSSVRVRRTSSGSYGATTSATLSIGGVDDTFSVTTMDGSSADTTPDPFTFTAVTGALPGAFVTSNDDTIRGIDAPATISVAGGSYSINGGSFTSAPGTITNGSTVRVRQTASGSYGATTTTTLTIGDVIGTFSVTTTSEIIEIIDIVPPFAFTPATGVARNTEVTSNAITVSGINVPVDISVAGGSYSINGGTFTTEPGIVINGDTVRVSQTSSGSYGTTTPATLAIGSVTGTFNVTTMAAGPAVRVGYSPQWLVITFAALMIAGGFLLRRRMARW